VTVNNLLKRTNTGSYWDIYPYLNPDTRDLIPALYAMTYSYHHDNSNGNKIAPVMETDTFYIEHQLQFKAIEDVASIQPEDLFFYNPILNKPVLPSHFPAVFPKNKMDKFYQLCD